MANYKQTTGPATAWTRANRVMILNPLEANIPKQISFFEETVVEVDSTVIKSDSGYCSAYFSPDKLIELRNPQTGEKTGETILQSKVYQAIYSLYLDAAESRDIQQASLQQPQPVPLAPNDGRLT
jgi:hypothetical protein